MEEHRPPEWWQILLACLAVLFGAGGGCTVGFGICFAKSESRYPTAGIRPEAIWLLWIVGGVVAGGIAAALVLRPRPRR